MKLSELKALIRQTIQEEVKAITKKYVQAYVPIVIKEVVDDLVEQRMTKLLESAKVSKKRVSIKEHVSRDMEEWPTLGGEIATTERHPQVNRAKLAALMGYGDASTARGVNTIENIVTEQGTTIPIAPDVVPSSVLTAMNKDYRKFMKALDGHKGAGSSVPIGGEA